MTDPDPLRAMMIQARDVGSFVRASLRVPLTGGYSITYGVWVEVATRDLHQALQVWWAPAYADLTLDGLLSNAIPPWDVLGAPVHLAVRNPDEAPSVASSGHPDLQQVLSLEWPHDLVLSASATVSNSSRRSGGLLDG